MAHDVRAFLALLHLFSSGQSRHLLLQDRHDFVSHQLLRRTKLTYPQDGFRQQESGWGLVTTVHPNTDTLAPICSISLCLWEVFATLPAYALTRAKLSWGSAG